MCVSNNYCFPEKVWLHKKHMKYVHVLHAKFDRKTKIGREKHMSVPLDVSSFPWPALVVKRTGWR